MTNLDSIFKSKDITLPTKVRLVKAMVFPVVMYGCESWTVKKAECQRIDAFELWCWRRLLRVPWTARRSNQSILKEISPGISLEGMMLKLKLQYFGHLCEELTHWKRLWCWEGLRAGGEGDDRMRWLDGITDLIDMGLGGLQELVGGLACCASWGRKQSGWVTEPNWYIYMKHIYILFCNYAYTLCTFSPISLFFLSSHMAVSSAISYGLFSSALSCGLLLCIGKVLCFFQLGLHFSCGFIFFSLLFIWALPANI